MFGITLLPKFKNLQNNMGKLLSPHEFIVLIAFLFSLIAIGTDMMLPALGAIGNDLGIIDKNKVQLVITIFLLGTGLGQLIAGPVSDAYGRKIVLSTGILLFIAASIWAMVTTSFTMLLIARFVQGLGISAPRSAGNAMVRDLYSGRKMARVISLAMMIFVLAPAVAPLLGQKIMVIYGWRAIFTACMFAGLLAFLWMSIRQKETLILEKRTPFLISNIISGYKTIFTNKRVIISTSVQASVLGGLFSYIASAPQIFTQWLNAEEQFPIYFCCIALISAFSNIINATLVERLGMWVMSTFAIGFNMIFSAIIYLVLYMEIVSDIYLLPIFLIWSVVVFLTMAMSIGNLMALAMEPVGHIAGLAASIIGSTSTLISILLAIPIGMMFDGTGMPLIASITILAITAFGLNIINPRSAN
jgi:DHA1 family bicyclomycin/chloramphenicol resistance-like MFS transporter|tara:strand:- start:60792 stop:62039 length:1248 start_codon:yes stop_codon:yes gene_type:complete